MSELFKYYEYGPIFCKEGGIVEIDDRYDDLIAITTGRYQGSPERKPRLNSDEARQLYNVIGAWLERIGALVALLAVLVASGCGGGATLVDCAPARVTVCIPTDAAGAACNVLASPLDGKEITSAECGGGDARINCFPADHLVCVTDCSGGGVRPACHP